MIHFDYANPDHRKIRSYRTRAIKAALYAQSPRYRSDAAMWAFIAERWTDLADIKERDSRNAMPGLPNR